MSAFESEIRQLKQKLESELSNQYEILSAHSEIVQIKFKVSNYRILTCVAQIPPEYPNAELLIELKSKHFSPILLKQLTALPPGAHSISRLTVKVEIILDDNLHLGYG